jgi:hypothetical protein
MPKVSAIRSKPESTSAVELNNPSGGYALRYALEQPGVGRVTVIAQHFKRDVAEEFLRRVVTAQSLYRLSQEWRLFRMEVPALQP